MDFFILKTKLKPILIHIKALIWIWTILSISLIYNILTSKLMNTLDMFGSDHEENIGYMYADGVLGMGPQDSSTRGYGLFVEQLYKNSLISNNGFGMNYPHIYNTSKVIFGGYDTTIVTDIA